MLGALDTATDEFGRRLRLLGEGRWTLPTPCSDWDLHYLVAHVIGGNRFAAHVLGGMGAMEAIDLVMSSPQLGDDAVAAWTSTCVEQAARFNADGALDRPIDHPLGEISGRQFLEFGSSTSRCTRGTSLGRSEQTIDSIQISSMSC